MAVGAAGELSDEDPLEFLEDPVQAQAAPAAFGVARRFLVMNRCAAETRVAWWYARRRTATMFCPKLAAVRIG